MTIVTFGMEYNFAIIFFEIWKISFPFPVKEGMVICICRVAELRRIDG